VAWASPTHSFASGEYGTFIETFDGGTTWRNINLDIFPSDPFYNVYCRDADNCFVVGNSGTNGPDHWRTTDSGATWQRITNFPLGGSWNQIDFVSASVGFMGSNGATARTTDGGATWTLRSDYSTCPVIYGMDFRDAQLGLTGGNRVSTNDGGPGIFKTTDAGVTWVRKFPQSSNAVLWLNDSTAIAIVGDSIYRSTDTGETWSEISSQIFTGLDEMTLLPNGTIVGVSGAGDGWRSVDGGLNWTRTLVGLGALPASWNVSFFDNQLGAIVGQGGFIFKTTDGGLTWAMLNNGIGGAEFRDLEMFDDNAGLAVGDNGYILRTENGGNRWDTHRVQVTGVVLFRNENLQAVSVVDQNFAVAAGYDGVVFKTFDRGKTWQSIGYPNLPGEFYISDVKFIDRNLGYVTGNRPGIAQNLFRTTDGGATWNVINLNLGHSIDFIDANRGWVMNVGGLGYRTTDGGASWQQMLLPNQGFSPTISKIDFINENEGWAVGWYGYAAHTLDGGVTWHLQNIATQEEHILGLHALSATEAFAVGSHAAPSSETANLYHTNNGGATWTKTPLSSEFYQSSIFATPSRKVWTSGFDGVVLHNPNYVTGPAPASVVSRKSHGASGAFDINLLVAGSAGIECRGGGTTSDYKVVFTFPSAVIPEAGRSGNAAGSPSVSPDGRTVTQNITNISDAQTIAITLFGVNDGTSTNDVTARMRLSVGDTNGNGAVNAADVSQTKSRSGQAISEVNFRSDVAINGAINAADLALVKSRSGGGASVSP
jgi:photosystem II stability/assembly factor-like uncharacterized protein